MAELQQVFQRTVEQLKQLDDIDLDREEKVAKILQQFEDDLPEGKVKKFFQKLERTVGEFPDEDADLSLRELKALLNKLRRAKKYLKKVPVQVPREIVVVYKEHYNMAIFDIKLCIETEKAFE